MAHHDHQLTGSTWPAFKNYSNFPPFSNLLALHTGTIPPYRRGFIDAHRSNRIESHDDNRPMMIMKPNLTETQIAGLLTLGYNVEQIHNLWRCNKERIRRIREKGVVLDRTASVWLPCISCGLGTYAEYILAKKPLCPKCIKLVLDD